MKPTPTMIANVVADHYGFALVQISAPGRTRAVSLARAVACHLSRGEGWSFPTIGAALGVDHTSVIYASRKIERRLSGGLDPVLTKDVGSIRLALGSLVARLSTLPGGGDVRFAECGASLVQLELAIRACAEAEAQASLALDRLRRAQEAMRAVA